MFQFLQPILLFSTAAIAVPVVIHLWNIKQGKTLKVGSISLLTKGSRQQARSLRLIDLLLLFLRCLLIVLLAFLIAKPLWQQSIILKKEKGWLLIEKENLRETYGKFQPKIDSLFKAGYAFHYFNSNFEKDNLQEALKLQKDTVSPDVSYWALLKELNQKVPASLPIFVFTKNTLKRFKGERPDLSLQLNWQMFAPSDSVSTYPADAFLTSSDSVRLLIGHGNSTATFYTYKNISQQQMSSADAKLEVNNGKLLVSLKDDNTDKKNIDTSAILVDTSTIRITIFTDKFYSDVNYLKVAIEAIKKYSGRKILLSVSNNFNSISSNQNWIFWLSEKSIPTTLSTENLFLYAIGKMENIHSWIITEDKLTMDKQPVSLARIIYQKTSDNKAETVWKDGFGNALLSKQQNGKATFYQFYSRFDPDWNDLVWSDEFPLVMMKLLIDKNQNQSHKNDKRMIDEKQIQPVFNQQRETVANDKFTREIDLSHFFWLAAFVIFFIERLLSFNKKKLIKNG